MNICSHLFALNAKTQFLSQVNSKRLIYLGCNVILPLEDLGLLSQHIRGRIAGCCMRGNASERQPVSLGLIAKQYAHGGINSVLL